MVASCLFVVVWVCLTIRCLTIGCWLPVTCLLIRFDAGGAVVFRCCFGEAALAA